MKIKLQLIKTVKYCKNLWILYAQNLKYRMNNITRRKLTRILQKNYIRGI